MECSRYNHRVGDRDGVEGKITRNKEVTELRGQDIFRTTYVVIEITKNDRSSGRMKPRAKIIWEWARVTLRSLVNVIMKGH